MGSTVYFASYSELSRLSLSRKPCLTQLTCTVETRPYRFKIPKQHRHTQVTEKVPLIHSAELLFLPSSPELRKCFMNAKVRRKLKDVIHMCISNDRDCIMPCILYSLISLPCRGKNPHPVVSNPLQVITP